jgi:hypothetical protein
MTRMAENDEIRMTKDEGITKREMQLRVSFFVIWSLFRHSTFVLRHFYSCLFVVKDSHGLAKPISIGAVERVVLNALAKPCGFAASFLAPSAI